MHRCCRHYRRRFLTRICEIAILELSRPDLAYGIMSSYSALKISTYFCKDLIRGLGENASVSTDVLLRLAQLQLEQRGAKDKGTRGAFIAVLEVMSHCGELPLRAACQSLTPSCMHMCR